VTARPTSAQYMGIRVLQAHSRLTIRSGEGPRLLGLSGKLTRAITRSMSFLDRSGGLRWKEGSGRVIDDWVRTFNWGFSLRNTSNDAGEAVPGFRLEREEDEDEWDVESERRLRGVLSLWLQSLSQRRPAHGGARGNHDREPYVRLIGVGDETQVKLLKDWLGPEMFYTGQIPAEALPRSSHSSTATIFGTYLWSMSQ